MVAGYNAWANGRIYEAAAQLPDSDYRANHGAFFKSLHGTLNHLLAGDRIWMKRFTRDGDAPSALDVILCETLPDLWAARQREDRRICDFADGLDDAALRQRFRYTTITNPATVEQELGAALDHFFNHQTHHRGQAHCILSMIGGNTAAPSLDLILFQREMGLCDILR
jgi:uncharacterized damage-inducible protein DinB